MIDSVLAAGPENAAMSISATLVPGEPGHYTVNFPLLPGATKFAFNYDLPYNGHATLSAKSIYSFKQVAVMIPPTMTFTSRSSAFQALPVGSDRYHVEAAENVTAGGALAFEISGAGELPEAHQPSSGAANPSATASIPQAPATATGISPTRNAAPKTTKIDPHSAAAWWWVLGGAAIAFALWMFLAMRRRSLRRRSLASIVQMRSPRLQSAASLVDALKEGLFQLESDRMQGAISGEDYASAKRAMEGTIRWAVARAQPIDAEASQSGEHLVTADCEPPASLRK
jgi:hypothetical protein